MNIVKEEAVIYDEINTEAVMRKLEAAGRVCYKSEAGEDTADDFVRRLIERGHESVLEHVSVTVKFVVDRGVSHEIVRHRMASYSQESTRYCNYSNDRFGNEITVIKPYFLEKLSGNIEDNTLYGAWEYACSQSEIMYFEMLENGVKPQEARSVLPNSLKTELFMTANLREWRHFFKLRCAPAAHPQMRRVATMLFEQFYEKLPVVFYDIKLSLED